MKIEKLPSGSYRIRKMYKGEMYTVIFDHKPTQKEAVKAIATELDKVQHKKDEALIFKAAAQKYIESKKNVLSPSTIRGYSGIMRQIPDVFLNNNIYNITALDVQAEINRVAHDKFHDKKLHFPVLYDTFMISISRQGKNRKLLILLKNL